MHALIDNLAGNHAEMTAIRRDIHAHPELGFEEHRTSDLVAEKLTDWGIEVTRGIGQTGLVGTLRVGNDPRSVGLRADMDALPIVEANPKFRRLRAFHFPAGRGRHRRCPGDGQRRFVREIPLRQYFRHA